MATGSMVPYSNPAGNNQTTPTGILATGAPKLPGAVPTTAPGTPMGTTNPFIPAPAAHPASTPVGVGMPGATPTGPSVPNVGGLSTTGANVAGDTGALQKQLVDIYGKGVGGSLESLLAGMSGTDSKILQDYIASLQPQEAKAQANVNASLGAGGVSANSSVQGIADASLQAQEFSAIAGESANLTQSQEQLTAQLLQGMQPSAQKEVATSNWSIFGDVVGAIAQDFGAATHGGQAYKPGDTPASPVPEQIGTQGMSSGVTDSTGANDVFGSVPSDQLIDPSLADAALFA